MISEHSIDELSGSVGDVQERAQQSQLGVAVVKFFAKCWQYQRDVFAAEVIQRVPNKRGDQ